MDKVTRLVLILFVLCASALAVTAMPIKIRPGGTVVYKFRTHGETVVGDSTVTLDVKAGARPVNAIRPKDIVRVVVRERVQAIDDRGVPVWVWGVGVILLGGGTILVKKIVG